MDDRVAVLQRGLEDPRGLVGVAVHLPQDLEQARCVAARGGSGREAGVDPVEDPHTGVHRCACGVRQRAGLAHDDALVMEVQPPGVLEGQTADARTGADHDGHPGAQVTASVTAERLCGIGGADDEDHVHTVQRLGDVGGDRRQGDEPLKLALGLDPAALADRHQMVLMGMLCVQRDLMPLTRPLVGDR